MVIIMIKINDIYLYKPIGYYRVTKIIKNGLTVKQLSSSSSGSDSGLGSETDIGVTFFYEYFKLVPAYGTPLWRLLND